MRKLLYVPLLLLWFSVQALSQNLVGFTYQIGDPQPTPVLYDIKVPPGVPQVALTLTTDGASWVLATLSVNSTPSVLTISVNPAGLAVGHYTSAATVSSTAGSQFFSITLDVTAAASATLTLSSPAFTFNAVAGGTAPATQQLGVTASSSTSATATVSETTCTGLAEYVADGHFHGRRDERAIHDLGESDRPDGGHYMHRQDYDHGGFDYADGNGHAQCDGYTGGVDVEFHGFHV